MDGTTIGGWLVERTLSTEGDVHAYAVSRDGTQAILHVVAPGASSTLLYAATENRKVIVRGRHEGNAYVVSTEAPPIEAKRSHAKLYAGIALAILAAGGVTAFVLSRGGASSSKACADCVLVVNGTEVSRASFRMYASDPYLFADRKADDKKRAALDLLVMRTLLHARATTTAPSDIAERAARGEYVIGMQRIDLRAKLEEAGEPFDAGTAERYAKSLGFATKQALFDEMKIEYVALAAREALSDDRAWFATECAKATIIVDDHVKKFVTDYRPCAAR